MMLLYPSERAVRVLSHIRMRFVRLIVRAGKMCVCVRACVYVCGCGCLGVWVCVGVSRCVGVRACVRVHLCVGMCAMNMGVDLRI